jgi:hypothetical protein
MLIFDDIIKKINKLEKLNSIDDFVEFYYEEINEFYFLFVDSSFEQTKYKKFKGKKSDIAHLLYMSVYEIIGNKTGLIINYNDFNSLKIIIFNEYILSKIIEKKHIIKKENLIYFEEIIQTLEIIYNFFVYKIKIYDNIFLNNYLIKKYIPDIDELVKLPPNKIIYSQYSMRIKENIKNNIFFNFLNEQIIPFIREYI